MTIDQMLKLGMRPRQLALLTVMEWPDPFLYSPWANLDTRAELDAPTLFDVLRPSTPATVREATVTPGG